MKASKLCLTIFTSATLALTGCNINAEVTPVDNSKDESPQTATIVKQEPETNTSNTNNSKEYKTTDTKPLSTQLSKTEVLNLLKKAYDAQISFGNGEFAYSTEKINATLKPYFTSNVINYFIEEAGDKTDKGWMFHSESWKGFILNYKDSYTKNVKITYSKDGKNIYVSGIQYLEAYEQGTLTVITTLSKIGDTWKVSEVKHKLK